MTSEGLIMVLCGLPGSGKSHMAKLLQEKINNGLVKLEACDLLCYVIEYDHLMPSSIEKELIEITKSQQEKGCVSEWKLYRQRIMKAVDIFLTELTTGENISLPENDEIAKLVIDIRQYQQYLSNKTSAKFVLIVDDNMYLESMRYPYYQLAKKHNCGFSQVHLTCDWHHQQNFNRDNKVTQQTMKTMAEKFEAPSLDSNCSLERFSCSISNNDDHFETCWTNIEGLIKNALSNPVSKDDDGSESKEIARQIGMKNIVHKADHLLRILISETMSEEKGKLNKESLRILGRKLNDARQNVLEEIRKDAVEVPEMIKHEIERGNYHSVNVLFKDFLKFYLKGKY